MLPSAAVIAATVAPARATAQVHPHEQHDGDLGMTGPLGIPQAREASGTAWLPDATPMYALTARLRAWHLMIHGNVFAQYIFDRSDRRGDDEAGSINWFMLMLSGPVAGGELEVRAMNSLEPFTIPGCAYPVLLATGELCNGEPIVDAQHEHDLFMELAAEYNRAITDDVGVTAYGGLVGEPALGPVAYPHRISAFHNPIAPITHHWLDATHISFGVLTAGVFGRRWRVEASLFNGREPDDARLDFDLAPLDSVAGRVAFAPTPRLALQMSAGYLNEAEEVIEPSPGRRDVFRATASATHHRPMSSTEVAAITVAWGMNSERGERITHAGLIEASVPLGANVLFGRIEVVEKDAHDLGLEGIEDVFTVGKASAGYVRELGSWHDVVPGIGAAVIASAIPGGLEEVYDAELPIGFAVFARLRPAAMKHQTAPGQCGAPSGARRSPRSAAEPRAGAAAASAAGARGWSASCR